MSEDAFVADKQITEGQQEGAGGIQRGIDSGKIGKLKDHALSLQLTVDS